MVKMSKFFPTQIRISKYGVIQLEITFRLIDQNAPIRKDTLKLLNYKKMNKYTKKEKGVNGRE